MRDSPSMTGPTLKRHRVRLKLTQKQMADRIGIHWNSLARMERGEMVVTKAMTNLIRLLPPTTRR